MIEKRYTIVQTPADVQALREHIANFDYHSFDTETTGLNVRKDKIIGFSISGSPGVAFYAPLLTWDKEQQKLIPVLPRNLFIELVQLLLAKDLLMWNGSFDIRITKNDLGIDLLPAFLADIMLMKHTVDEEGDFGLKEVALSLQAELDMDPEDLANQEQLALKENVLANGGSWTKANKQMFMADLEVLGYYACADADLTLRLAEYFKGKLEREGLEEFFYDKEVMPLYREVTIPMEERGVHLDLALIHRTRAELEVDMSRLGDEVRQELMATPEAQKWLKDKIIADYPAARKGAFANKLAEIYALDLPRTPSGGFSFAGKAIAALPESIPKRFLLGEGILPEDVSFDISKSLFEAAGEGLNISSKHQLKAIVFDYMGIKPLSQTKKGNAQFDDDVIQHLADKFQFPWALKLSSYNKLVKIMGTYIERFLDAHEDGIYYFSYKQHGTISGRFSGDAQQMPRPKEEEELDPIVLKYNNAIRSFFIAPEGRIFIDSDYESLEPHVFAHVSGDEGLRDIFRKGHDFYSSIAIPTEKLQGVSADKKAENYLGKVDKPRRQSAKAYALGVPYGMTAYALGKTLDVSDKEAQKLIDGYLDGFPNLKAWMQRSEDQARYAGFVTAESGRVRHLPQVKALFKIHKDKLLDWRYRKKILAQYGEAEVKRMYGDYKNGLNNAKNVQIQGLSASIVNAASIAITREFKRLGIDGFICANIHDQIIVNIAEAQAEQAKEIVERLMKTTTKLSLELKAPPSLAKNWKEGH